MAVFKVSPNRMELSRIRNRRKIAVKGHKLLKDKQEQLVRHFLEITKNVQELRAEVDFNLVKAYQSFILAKAIMGEDKVESAILVPEMKTDLKVSYTSIMNLKVPHFTFEVTGNPLCYSPIESSVELDESVSIFASILEKMLLLAEIEKKIMELAKEIVSTRRRVNALEYVLIPKLDETIIMIKNKLNELERSNIVKLMFVNNLK